MANAPQITLGLPVYNGLPYVEELIGGLLAQSFGDFELVISDNASTDGTSELCCSYAAADKRVKYFRNASNIGAIPNFNRVFELGNAPHFKWVSADDIYAPAYLEVCFPPIRDDAGISVSHSATVLVDETGAELPYDAALHAYTDPGNNRIWLLDQDSCAVKGSRARRFRDVLAHQIMCSPIYGLMRREQLRQTALQMSFFGSDKLTLAEMALAGRFHIAPERLFKKRMHSGMTSVMSGGTQQTKIDPGVKFSSRHLVKLGAYLHMLARKRLTLAERAQCYAYLGVHSASALVPEMLRYRPELLTIRLGLKRPSTA